MSFTAQLWIATLPLALLILII